MKLETILNAYVMAEYAWAEGWGQDVLKYDHQRKAFRARIIKMDAQQREDIQELGTALDMVLADLEEQSDEIGKKNAEIHWLNQRVHELKGEIDCLRS